MPPTGHSKPCLVPLFKYFVVLCISLSPYYTARAQKPTDCLGIKTFISVPENTKIGETIFEYQDVTGYESSTGSQYFDLKYDAVMRSLSCTLKKEVDAESISRDLVKIKCQSLSSYLTIQIDIADVNDELPKFTLPEISYSIPEDWPLNIDINKVGDSTLTFEDKDRDLINRIGTVELENKVHVDTFSVSIKPGTQSIQITLKEKLDYEKTKVYDLPLILYDKSVAEDISKMKVTINLQNVIDEPPVFDKDYYSGFIDEKDYESFSLPIKANDKDEDKTTAIEYSFSPLGNAPSDFFQIDPATGVFKATSMFQVLPNMNPMEYKITAQKAPDLLSSCLAAVFVNGQAITSPINIFTEKIQQTRLKENSPGKSFYKVLYNYYKGLAFSIVKQTPEDTFVIDSTTGELSLVSGVTLDRETTAEASIVIVGHLGTRSNEKETDRDESMIVMIEVLDENDVPPQFKEKKYHTVAPHSELSPRFHPTSPLLSVQANDPDLNSEIKYSIANKNDGNIFQIDNNSGAILASKPMNCEEECEFEVIANDGVNQGTTKVEILLIYWKHVVEARLTLFKPLESFQIWLESKYQQLIYLAIEEQQNLRSNKTYLITFVAFGPDEKLLLAEKVIKDLKMLSSPDWGVAEYSVGDKEVVSKTKYVEVVNKTPVIVLGVLVGILGLLLILSFIWNRRAVKDQSDDLEETEMKGISNASMELSESTDSLSKDKCDVENETCPRGESDHIEKKEALAKQDSLENHTDKSPSSEQKEKDGTLLTDNKNTLLVNKDEGRDRKRSVTISDETTIIDDYEQHTPDNRETKHEYDSDEQPIVQGSHEDNEISLEVAEL